MAYDSLRSESCPNCGVEPLDFMNWSYKKIKCPTCKTEYGRAVPYEYSKEVPITTKKV